MNNLQKYLTAIDFDISNGGEFCWNCFPKGRYISAMSDTATVDAVVDGHTDTIYQVDVRLDRHPSPDKPRAYRWTNPDWDEAYQSEARSLGQTPHVYGHNDTRYAITEDYDDILAKAAAGLRDLASFDTRVVMQFELDEDVLATLRRQADEAGMDFDRYIEQVLELELARIKSEDNTGSA